MNATPFEHGISVVVPVYNAEGSIAPLLDRLLPILESHPGGHEVILVDDGSADRSWERIEAAAEERPAVRGLRLMRNSGQHNALLAGVRACRFSVTVTMDDDLQHPPEELPKLVARVGGGASLVYGTPAALPHARWRNVTSWITKGALAVAANAPIARSVSAFRAFDSRLRWAFEDFAAPDVSLDVLLSWATKDVASVQVRHDPRTIGASGYTVRKLVKHALNMLTGYSVWPLRLASITGFVFTLFGMFLLAWVLFNYAVHGQRVPGFAFLASSTAVFAGGQLFALGIIGEYLGRIHSRSQGRPPYTVARKTPPSRG